MKMRMNRLGCWVSSHTTHLQHNQGVTQPNPKYSFADLYLCTVQHVVTVQPLRAPG